MTKPCNEKIVFTVRLSERQVRAIQAALTNRPPARNEFEAEVLINAQAAVAHIVACAGLR